MFYQPGPDSVGIFAISHSCNGVAARACGLVSLEPTKVQIRKFYLSEQCFRSSHLLYRTNFDVICLISNSYRLWRSSKIVQLGCATVEVLKYLVCYLLETGEQLNLCTHRLAICLHCSVISNVLVY